jgi:hypothetical protein
LIDAGSNGIDGGVRLLETVAGERNGRRLKTTGRWGPPVGEEGRYRFGCCWNGPRALFFSGPNQFPGVQNVFILFSFLFFFFWISDLSFEKVLLFRFERKQG